MNIFLTTLLITSLGMSAVILLLMIFNKLMAARIRASIRYYTWFIVLAGLLIPFRPNVSLPFEPISIPMQRASHTSASIDVLGEDLDKVAAVSESEQSATVLSPISEKPIIPYTLILFGFWVAGTLSVLAFHIRAYAKFSSSVRRWSVKVDDESVLSVMREVMDNMGLAGKRIGVKTCMLVSSPMLVGFLTPTILLPENEISPDELEHVFRHELTHYKRRDLWTNLLVLLTSAIHWFNPFVHLMAKAIWTDCEASCDEMVLVGDNVERRKHYGETILGFITTGNTRIPVLSTYFYGGSNHMKKRLLSIMDTGRKNTWLALPCVIAIAMATVLSGTVFAVAKDTRQSDTRQRYIGEAAAKSIAIQNVGGAGIVTGCTLDHNPQTGALMYRVTIANKPYEYSIELDAATGTVYKVEQVPQKTMALADTMPEASFTPPPPPMPVKPSVYNYSQPQANITYEIAQSTALARVGGGTIARTETKYPRHGGIEYKVVIVNGDYKYNVHVNAQTGSIINYHMDPITKTGPLAYQNNAVSAINADRAKSIAIQNAGGGIVTDCNLDYKRHQSTLIYHIHVANGQYEYCIELDASTGTVYKVEPRLKP